MTLVRRQLTVQADADVALAAVEAKTLARMKLAQQVVVVAASSAAGFGRADKPWLRSRVIGRADGLHAVVTGAGHEVVQTSTGAAHALLAVVTGVRGFPLLALLAHLTRLRSAARLRGAVVRGRLKVQVEVGLKNGGTVAIIKDQDYHVQSVGRTQVRRSPRFGSPFSSKIVIYGHCACCDFALHN